MIYEIFEDKVNPGDWRVESEPYDDGLIDVTIFSGNNAEARAREYALFKVEA